MAKIPLDIIAIIFSIIATAFGIFGGIPGIKQLFFSQPSIIIDGIMPVVVFEDGYDLTKDKPKFSLKCLIKIFNPNNYDISITEMKIYGTSRESISHNLRPFYELNIVGVLDKRQDIIKAYGNSFLKFHFAHFDNVHGPGTMLKPIIAEEFTRLKQPVVHIFIPSFNQLFKYNEKRIPYSLVDDIPENRLFFGVVFNNEIIKIGSSNILSLHHAQIQEWDDDSKLFNWYNAAKELDKKVKHRITFK